MSRTDTTLLEQMQISDLEIANRMELLSLTKSALSQIAQHKEL